MTTERSRLIQIARRLSDTAGRTFKGRWCFFAGFAFMLDGIEKMTYDIDVLTKDEETFHHITNVLHKIGLATLTKTKNYSSFRIPLASLVNAKELTLDLLCITSEWLKPLEGMWSALEEKEIDGSRLPVASPVHLVLLKVLVNYRRQANDRKKEQDLVDVSRLMSIRGMTSTELRDEARKQGLAALMDEFLSKIKNASPSG